MDFAFSLNPCKEKTAQPFPRAAANPFGSSKLLASQRELWGRGLVGVLLAGVGLASMIVQGGLVQPLIKRIGERPALLTGLVCASIGMTWYGTAWEGQLVWLGIPLAAFGGLYNATSQSVMSPRVSALEPGQLQGGNSSIMAFAGILGPSVFASVFAKSIDTGHDFDLPGAGFWLAGLCLLLALLLARLPTR